jgi:hypothetical protein
MFRIGRERQWLLKETTKENGEERIFRRGGVGSGLAQPGEAMHRKARQWQGTTKENGEEMIFIGAVRRCLAVLGSAGSGWHRQPKETTKEKDND